MLRSPGSGLFRSPNKQRGRGAAGVRSRGFLPPSAGAARAAAGHRKPVEVSSTHTADAGPVVVCLTHVDIRTLVVLLVCMC